MPVMFPSSNQIILSRLSRCQLSLSTKNDVIRRTTPSSSLYSNNIRYQNGSQLLRQQQQQRTMASDAAVTESATTTSSSGGGAGFFQRLSSFLSGAGLTALATQYFLYEEIKNGNRDMIKKQKDIEQRIVLLETKK